MTSPSRTFDHPAPAAACIRATRPEPCGKHRPGLGDRDCTAVVQWRCALDQENRGGACDDDCRRSGAAAPPRPPGRARQRPRDRGPLPTTTAVLIWRSSIENSTVPDFVATGFAKSSLEGLAGRCPRETDARPWTRSARFAKIPTAARTACTHNVSHTPPLASGPPSSLATDSPNPHLQTKEHTLTAKKCRNSYFSKRDIPVTSPRSCASISSQAIKDDGFDRPLRHRRPFTATRDRHQDRPIRTPGSRYVFAVLQEGRWPPGPA
jgi:hypothetical protein